MNIDNYLLKDYIINASDIKYLLKTKTLKKLLKEISNDKITITNKQIHHQDINHIENFILILDQYIYFIKKQIFLDPLEIRYLIELSIDNKYSNLFANKKYYLDNEDYYLKEFKKLFLHNFKINQRIIKKNVNNYQVINNYKSLCNLINNNKDKYYILFETYNNIENLLSNWKKIKFN